MPRRVICMGCDRPTFSAGWHGGAKWSVNSGAWYCAVCWVEKFGNDSPIIPDHFTFFRPEIMLGKDRFMWCDDRVPLRETSTVRTEKRKIKIRVTIEEIND